MLKSNSPQAQPNQRTLRAIVGFTSALPLLSWLLIMGLLLPNMPVAQARSKILAHELRLTRFNDLLTAVSTGDDYARRDFVAAALDVMIDAYLAEIEKLDGAKREESKDKMSWRRGTLAYVSSLEKHLEKLIYGAPVDMVQEPDGSVRFIIGREQIMFHGPRVSQQRALEQTLADSFCVRDYCDRRTPTAEVRAQNQMSQVKGRWRFEERSNPTYTADDGLQCVFDDERHLSLKREACKSLIYELRFLAEALKAVVGSGNRVDWARIKLASSGDNRPNRLIYNRQGQYFHARLPGLWRAQNVLSDAIPWIQARITGAHRPISIRPPDTVVYQVGNAPN